MKTIYTTYGMPGELRLTDNAKFRPCTVNPVMVGCVQAGHRGNRVTSNQGCRSWDDLFDDAVRYAFSEKHPTLRLWYIEWGWR